MNKKRNTWKPSTALWYAVAWYVVAAVIIVFGFNLANTCREVQLRNQQITIDNQRVIIDNQQTIIALQTRNAKAINQCEFVLMEIQSNSCASWEDK